MRIADIQGIQSQVSNRYWVYNAANQIVAVYTDMLSANIAARGCNGYVRYL